MHDIYLCTIAGTIAPVREVHGEIPPYLNLNVLVPTVCALFIFVVGTVIICYLKGRDSTIKGYLYTL